MKSTLTGLCKLSMARPCPTELMLEEIALHAFRKAGKDPVDKFITLHEFIQYCHVTPEVNTWVHFFDSPAETQDVFDLDDSDVETEVKSKSMMSFPTKTHMGNHDACHDGNDMIEDGDALKDPLCYVTASSSSSNHPSASTTAEPTRAWTIQPWQNTVANAVPSSASSLESSSSSPPSLELDWIYGMNANVRQCVQYVSTNEIAYPAAAVVVLYDHVEHKQRYIYIYIYIVSNWCLKHHHSKQHTQP
jgi:hypothetical protein